VAQTTPAREHLVGEVQWSLRQPIWVQLLATAVTLTAVAALTWTLIWAGWLAGPEPSLWLAVLVTVVAVGAALAGVKYQGKRSKFSSAGLLCTLPGQSEQWRVLDDSGRAILAQARVLHRWAGPGWLTLRLQGSAANPSNNQPKSRHTRCMDVVVWRQSVAPQAWRELQKWSIRQAAQVALGLPSAGSGAA